MTTDMISQEWMDALARSGARQTGARRVIVEVITGSERALEPLQIFETGRKRYSGLGLVTVYRTLEKLEELGLVARVHQPGGCNMYIKAAQGHQHLMICTGCNRAEYFDGDDLGVLFQRIAGQSGFNVKDHWLQLFGLCKACQNSAA
ncbi:MAG: transcriptional repressor [Anaerolineaceae bacterium]|nr:transcriptional repressor [Anaerolineaceae bacterium]NTV36856.1 transcriptional repressor [Anaerolineaceae bacterium]